VHLAAELHSLLKGVDDDLLGRAREESTASTRELVRFVHAALFRRDVVESFGDGQHRRVLDHTATDDVATLAARAHHEESVYEFDDVFRQPGAHVDHPETDDVVAAEEVIDPLEPDALVMLAVASGAPVVLRLAEAVALRHLVLRLEHPLEVPDERVELGVHKLADLLARRQDGGMPAVDHLEHGAEVFVLEQGHRQRPLAVDVRLRRCGLLRQGARPPEVGVNRLLLATSPSSHRRTNLHPPRRLHRSADRFPLLLEIGARCLGDVGIRMLLLVVLDDAASAVGSVPLAQRQLRVAPVARAHGEDTEVRGLFALEHIFVAIDPPLQAGIVPSFRASLAGLLAFAPAWGQKLGVHHDRLADPVGKLLLLLQLLLLPQLILLRRR